jgi:hypothetical protein
VTQLSDYRSELVRLYAENHRLRIQLAEQRGANSALDEIIIALRKRLDQLYAQKLRLILSGAERE